jgi:hypothetical protein
MRGKIFPFLTYGRREGLIFKTFALLDITLSELIVFRDKREYDYNFLKINAIPIQNQMR